MSIDEAIEHARAVSEDTSVCQKCRNEHAQLVKWLEELKALKKGLGVSSSVVM